MTKNTTTQNELKTILLDAGFLLPTTPEDIEKYEMVFGSTDVLLPGDFDSPDFLFKEKDNRFDEINKVVEMSSHKNDYFKKLVLSAAIAGTLYPEPTFGHVKFVKLNYLCEEVCNMQLSSNYAKYAAGPLDPKHMHTVDAEFKKRKWFKVTRRSGGKGFTYEPDINFQDYKKYYSKYFGAKQHLISQILELFRKKTTDNCEIVATVFFVWKQASLENKIINDDLLVNHFYDWGEQKKRFTRENIKNAISWMREQEIVPIIK